MRRMRTEATMRNLFTRGVVTAILCMMGGHASAWQGHSSGGFSLEQHGTFDIFTMGAAVDVGISVQVMNGSVDVEYDDGSSWTLIGTVGAGTVGIFEGEYARVRVKGMDAVSDGTYACRTSGGMGATIGAGSIVLSSTPVRVYLRSGAADRILSITVSTGSSDTAAVHLTSSGSSILDVDAGDDGVVQHTTAEYWLSGVGTALVGAAESKEEWSEWKQFKRNARDTVDEIYHSGVSINECRDYEVKNTGGNKFKVTYKEAGQAPVTVEVDPEDDFVFNCNMEYVQIEYIGSGSSGETKGEWRHKKHT